MKKIVLLLLFLLSLLTTACFDAAEPIYINDNVDRMVVGGEYAFESYLDNQKVFYVSDNIEIVQMVGTHAVALSSGECVIYAYNASTSELVRSICIIVDGIVPQDLNAVIDKNNLKKGETAKIEVSTNTKNADLTCSYKSSDTNVVTVSKDGLVTAIGPGLAVITVTSAKNTNVFKDVYVLVHDEEQIIKVEEKEENITQYVNITDLKKILEPIIIETRKSVIGVRSYKAKGNSKIEEFSASGIIYKKEAIEDQNKYYVITNRHLVNEKALVTVYDQDEEIEATVIACDSKVDVAVLTFISQKEYEVAKCGNSDNVKTGEFIITIGNTYGLQGYHSASFGIVSYPARYLSDDIDGDGTSDWDALYIQHDASISDGTSGGPLVNLNGEIIGLTTMKISDVSTDNMAFSIPINLVLELASQLEQGIVPQRPLLGVTVIDIKNILSSESLMNQYNLPEGITYGMYIQSVVAGGVAEAAGVLAGDILLEFDGIKVRYSYNLRAALGEVIIGSGEEVVLKVYRNGQIVTLKAVF